MTPGRELQLSDEAAARLGRVALAAAAHAGACLVALGLGVPRRGFASSTRRWLLREALAVAARSGTGLDGAAFLAGVCLQTAFDAIDDAAS